MVEMVDEFSFPHFFYDSGLFFPFSPSPFLLFWCGFFVPALAKLKAWN